MNFGINRKDPSEDPRIAAQLAAQRQLSYNPQAFNQNPAIPATAPQRQAFPGLIGPATNPVSFGHLTGATRNGPGSFIQTEEGQTKLARPIAVTHKGKDGPVQGLAGGRLFLQG